jgi:hypothetical protein
LRIIRQLKEEKTVAFVGLKETTPIEETKSNSSRLYLTVDMINNPFIAFFNKFQEEVQIQEFNKTRL